MKFRNILFPVDFSEESRRIAPAVRAFQSHFAARLTLFYVVDVPESWRDVAEQCAGVLNLPILRRLCRERLRQFAAECFPGSPYEIAEGEGSPGHGICEYADRNRIDLIMMAAHGHGLIRSTLGSVTTKVLHRAGCPVIAFGAEARIGEKMPARILYGLDPFEEADALTRAGSLARELGATLSAVYAIPDFAGTPEEQYERKRLSGPAEKKLQERIAKLQGEAGVSASVELAGGEVENVIAETARRQSAEMIVLGCGHVHGILGGIRSHVAPVIRAAPCPVMVL
ncbi:MAG TPA: universal stress protein [Bryobacteraceae bacterium]|nr:universal stress protein [Bryobacteraceae bacterium]